MYYCVCIYINWWVCFHTQITRELDFYVNSRTKCMNLWIWLSFVFTASVRPWPKKTDYSVECVMQPGTSCWLGKQAEFVYYYLISWKLCRLSNQNCRNKSWNVMLLIFWKFECSSNCCVFHKNEIINFTCFYRVSITFLALLNLRVYMRVWWCELQEEEKITDIHLLDDSSQDF